MDEILGTVFCCHTDPTHPGIPAGVYALPRSCVDPKGFVANRENSFIFQVPKDLGAGEKVKSQGRILTI